jgi:hypothetical protein
MDWQIIINVGAAGALASIGWFARQIWEMVQDLKEDIKRIEVELPTHYVSKDDFNDRWNEVLKALHRLEDKMDRVVELERK